MTKTTQADRDAAAEHIPAIGMANSVLSGKSDNHTLVQAFVNHRKTAAAEERAKIVAWLRDNPDHLARKGWLSDAIEAKEYLK